MRSRLLIALCLLAPLGGMPSKYSFQDLQLNVEDLEHKLRHQKGELELIYERLANLEDEIYRLANAQKSSSTTKLLEQRLKELEKGQTAFLKDLKTIKESLHNTQKQIAVTEEKVGRVDEKLAADLKELRSTLSSAITLLQTEPSQESYIVKEGDSLGKIAQQFKTSVKQLKAWNNLSSDVIHTGQKLIVFQN